MANKKLSELTERVNLPTNALIHILDPNDLSQSPQGSDFKFDSTKLVETSTSLQAKRPLKTIEGQSLEGFGNVVLPNNTAIQSLSTGLNQGGLLTINTNAAKFNLSAGFGYVVNGHSDPDNTTRTKVTWTAKIANIIPNLSTQKQTYIAIDINGDLFLTNVPLTATQRRNYIRIGVLIHLNNSAVTYIDNQPTINIEIGGQMQDILEALGFRSLSGNRVFPVSNNLKIKKELGIVFKSGANFDNLTTQPHSFTLAAQEPITFKYRTQTGDEGSDITDITPAIYDLNGTITPVAATATLATIQRVYIFQDGGIRIQPGQRVFTTLNAAITAINSDFFVTDLDISENGLYLGAIVLTRNTVDLSNISQAIFAPSIGTTANGSVASPALGYNAEDVANKQNNLAIDGTGAKYTTVDAVNAGLYTKINTSEKAVANGVASLGADRKVPLSQVNNNVSFSLNQRIKDISNSSSNITIISDSFGTGAGSTSYEKGFASRLVNSIMTSSDRSNPNYRGYKYPSIISQSNAFTDSNINTNGTFDESGAVSSRLILTTGKTITVTGRNINYFDVFYDSALSSGSIVITLNGAVIQTKSILTGTGIKSTFTTNFSTKTTAATDVITLTVTGNLVVTGMQTYRESQYSPFVNLLARSGYSFPSYNTSANLDEIASYVNFLNYDKKYIAIALGTNSIYNPDIAVEPSEYITQLQSFIANLNLRCSGVTYIITIPAKSNESIFPIIKLGFTYENYVNALVDFCNTNDYAMIRYDKTQLSSGSNAYLADGLHPNDLGHSILSAKWCEALGIKVNNVNVADVDNFITDNDFTNKLNTRLSDYLPLSGGTLSGDLKTNKPVIFQFPSSNWGLVQNSFNFTPRDGIDATADFDLKMWNGTAGTAGYGSVRSVLNISGSTGDIKLYRNLLMKSPDGSTWSGAMSNSGVLVWTKI